MRLVSLLAALALAACATTAARDVEADCLAGHGGACAQYGAQLASGQTPELATQAYLQGCDAGDTQSCLAAGRTFLDAGALDQAQGPLQRAFEDETEETHLAMAELLEAQATPESLSRAIDVRFDAPSIEHPPSTVVARAHGSAQGLSTDLLIDLQPMLFLSRRLAAGLHANFSSPGFNQLDVFAACQFYPRSNVVPFGRGFVGTQPRTGHLNAGVELGVKLALPPVGHLELALGWSLESKTYVAIGLGINSLYVGIALAYVLVH